MNPFDIQPGSEVFVYREKTKQMEGPSKLVAYEGYKTAKVLIGEKAQPFSISVIKEFFCEKDELTRKQGEDAEIEVGEKVEIF